ncbi:MAG: hypothetical protein EPN30_10680 [Actinomycetota bacterium]|nr:MAG: hypothetical protein EPN30_10680 [Actinomycetota bacterium]
MKAHSVTDKARILIKQTVSKAWLQFAVLCTVIFFIPAIFGHPLASGDNLIQFNPLRVLAAQIERHGNLPLWNQFNWSGTPLLAGFNAGAFYPTSWLYIFLPSAWAWGISQGLPYFAASLGFYLLMKETGVSEFSSRITGLSFAFAGVMITQGVHLDMISGISMAPWLLLFASRIIEPSQHSRLRSSIYLAICFALVILAGAPEAMLDELILLVVFSLAKLLKYQAQWPKKLLWLTAAGLLAIGISAAQWVPGLAYQKISQRANPTTAFVAFGAFAPQYFYSLFAPYLFGGPGRGVHIYFGPFTFEEVSIYPTIGPIIALFTTIIHAVKRTLDSVLIPYLLIAVIGVVLALGSYTPVESLLYHLPLYGQQRLQGRNILDLDVAMFAFFGIWLDRLLQNSDSKRPWIRWLAFLPAAMIVVLYGSFFRYKNFVTRFLHAGHRPQHLTNLREALIFAIELLIALIAGYVYLKAPKLSRNIAKSLIVAIVLVDLFVFNLFGSLGTPSFLSQFSSTTRQDAYIHTLIGDDYRFAIFDPHLYSFSDLNWFGQPDLNIAAGNHSIQGYSSLSLAQYENATGSHAQATLWPPLLASPLVDTLATKVILTNWRYLTSPYGSPTAVPLPDFYVSGDAAPGTLPQSQSSPNFQHSPLQPGPTDTYGLFGRNMSITGVDVSLGQRFSPETIKEVGLLENDGSIVQLAPAAPGPSERVPGALHYSLPAQANPRVIQASGVVVRQILPLQISDPQQALVAGVGVSTTKGYFALAGELQPYLTFPHFRPLGTSGSISIFDNSRAQPIIKAPATKVQILSQSTALNGTLRLSIASPAATTISRAEAYAPGWQARYSSAATGRTFQLPVINAGGLQNISVPAGKWNITVFYHPKSAYVGIWISLASIFVLAVFLALRYLRKRSLN